MEKKTTMCEEMEKIDILMHLNGESLETLRKIPALIREDCAKNIKSMKKEKQG